MKKKHKQYVIRSPFRFILFMTLFFCMCIFAFTMVFCINTANSMEKTTYAEIQVQPGDTLWAIASKNRITETDLRTVVYKICKLNDISADELQPGQVIKVPLNKI